MRPPPGCRDNRPPGAAIDRASASVTIEDAIGHLRVHLGRARDSATPPLTPSLARHRAAGAISAAGSLPVRSETRYDPNRALVPGRAVPKAATPRPRAAVGMIVLIDNYDSFTYNLV